MKQEVIKEGTSVLQLGLEGWQATDDLDEALEGINQSLGYYGLQLIEGTDEEGEALGGDTYFRMNELQVVDSPQMHEASVLYIPTGTDCL